MYEDNRNNGFGGNGSPDDHRAEDSQGENRNMESQQAVSRTEAGDSQDGIQRNADQKGGQYQGEPQQQPGSGYMGNGSGQYRQSQQPENRCQPPYTAMNPNPGPGAGRPPFAGSYQNTQYYGPQNQGMPNGPMPGGPAAGNAGQKSGKHRKIASKVAGITAAALLFGVISGGTMVGVNMVADSLRPETAAYPQVSQAETQTSAVSAETTPSGVSDSGAGNLVAMDVSSIVYNAMPSIVAINNTTLYQSNSWFGMPQTYEVPSSGSGIIVGQNDEELLIVTNNHVVQDATSMSVVFIDNTSVNAAIKGTDADLDLAVIAVPLKDIPSETLGQISVATLGNSDELKMGQGVVAIGNALGHGQSITVGYISALDREVTTEGSITRNLLQTDAAINPGNSGGALLNMKGEVIGINAAKYSSTEVEGVGYAIPISKVQDIISSLMTKRTRGDVVEEGKEGYLGIQGFTVEDSMVKQLGMPSGIFVSGIIEDGAASKTDLREKDIITKFDDQTVRTMASLQELLRYYKEGETVNMTVQSLENGQYVERTIEITLGGRATLEENVTAGQKQ
ncbi:MAG: trypsin-like serine protease [Hungatella sp.]|nr:trypsin-like serine protease [Hungatella sp.]